MTPDKARKRFEQLMDSCTATQMAMNDHLIAVAKQGDPATCAELIQEFRQRSLTVTKGCIDAFEAALSPGDHAPG